MKLSFNPATVHPVKVLVSGCSSEVRLPNVVTLTREPASHVHDQSIFLTAEKMPSSKWHNIAQVTGTNTSKPRQFQVASTRLDRKEQALCYHQRRLPSPYIGLCQGDHLKPALKENLHLFKEGLWWLYTKGSRAGMSLSRANFAECLALAVEIAIGAVVKDESARPAGFDVNVQCFVKTLCHDKPYEGHLCMINVLNEAVGGPDEYQRTQKSIDERYPQESLSYAVAYFSTLERIGKMAHYTLQRGLFQRKDRKVKTILIWAKKCLTRCIEELSED